MRVNYYIGNNDELVTPCVACAGRRPMEQRGEPTLVCDECGVEEDYPADKPLTHAERAWRIDGF